MIQITKYSELPKNYTGQVNYLDGGLVWYKDGKQHREDGPATILSDGTSIWAIEGKYHRIDEPAIIYPDGTKEWWFEGKLHRTNGPSFEYPYLNKTKRWHLYGESYNASDLEYYFQTSVYLGKEIEKYGLEWMKFMTETGIEYFPIIPGMENDSLFKPIFDKFLGS